MPNSTPFTVLSEFGVTSINIPGQAKAYCPKVEAYYPKVEAYYPKVEAYYPKVKAYITLRCRRALARVPLDGRRVRAIRPSDGVGRVGEGKRESGEGGVGGRGVEQREEWRRGRGGSEGVGSGRGEEGGVKREGNDMSTVSEGEKVKVQREEGGNNEKEITGEEIPDIKHENFYR
ncbi:hypothetical protein HAZT_HAZT003360 [Hyalella azteca]|uniref:Uncharacterized protein n=1 Tax=Hyalella azteca TaxID=294128 RepID=A0A6A0HAD0_HYAAZ|nr:hypothetical protein HAZT_HAZT003360 [Hyalella azteca]